MALYELSDGDINNLIKCIEVANKNSGINNIRVFVSLLDKLERPLVLRPEESTNRS